MPINPENNKRPNFTEKSNAHVSSTRIYLESLGIFIILSNAVIIGSALLNELAGTDFSKIETAVAAGIIGGIGLGVYTAFR